MNIAIVGAGMGGLTAGIALKNLVIRSQSMSKQPKYYLLALPSHFGQMVLSVLIILV